MAAPFISNQLTWFEHLIRRPPGHLSLKTSAHIRLGGARGADPKQAAGIVCRIWTGNTPGSQRMDGWTDGRMNGRTDEWRVDGRRAGWVDADRQVDRLISVKLLEDEEALMGKSEA